MTATTIRTTLAATLLAFVTLVGITPAGPAQAQALQCGPRGDIVETLGARFKETRHGLGLVSSTRILELYASHRGSWTILFTAPNGISCIGAAGSHWQAFDPAPGTSYQPSRTGPDR